MIIKPRIIMAHNKLNRYGRANQTALFEAEKSTFIGINYFTPFKLV